MIRTYSYWYLRLLVDREPCVCQLCGTHQVEFDSMWFEYRVRVGRSFAVAYTLLTVQAEKLLFTGTLNYYSKGVAC